MIVATVGSRSCLCWLYPISPYSASENVINLISVLTIWWCPYVESSLVLLGKKVFAMTSVFFSQNSVRLCPASFCTPSPNLPVIPGISWLSTFVFQSPVMKRPCFLFVWLVFGIVIEDLSLVAPVVKNLLVMWKTWVRSLGWEDPQEEGMATHFSILAWINPMDGGARQAVIHEVAKNRTWLRGFASTY